MKNKFFIIAALMIFGWLLIGCTATTTFTKKEPVPMVITVKTPNGDSTIVVTKLAPVYEFETTEKTFFGTSRTTVRDMTRGHKDVKTGDIYGAVEAAIKKNDANLHFFEKAPFPNTRNDWRQIGTYSGYPLYSYMGSRGYTGYYHHNRYYGNVSDINSLEGKLKLPYGYLTSPQ